MKQMSMGVIGLGALLLASVATADVRAERTVPPLGIREQTPAVHALINARIVVSPTQTIERGAVVLRDGIIVAVGAAAAVPADARVWDLDGKTIYPGLIDAYTKYTPAGPADGGARRGGGGAESETPGTPPVRGGANYWSNDIKPHNRVERDFKADEKANETFRSQGITVRLAAPGDAIIAGTSALVATGDGDAAAAILRDGVAMHGVLSTSRSWGDREYPNSPMGAMTLFRQAFYDADWYAKAWAAHTKDRTLPRPERNDALDAMAGYMGSTKPVIIDASDEMYFLRADQVGRELGLNVVVHGSGREYRRLDAIRATGRSVIVPLDFPKAPDVKTPEKALRVSLEDLMHWDSAPENAGRLANAGVPIAFCSEGLKDTKTFLEQVRTTVKRGLSADAALRALTVTPATWYGMADRLGTIETGKLGNLLITDGPLFDGKTSVIETWVSGERYEVKSPPVVEPRGKWELTLSERRGQPGMLSLSVEGAPDKLKGKIAVDTNSVKLDDVSLSDARLAISVKADTLGWTGVTRMSGTVIGDDLIGDGIWSDGAKFTLTGRRTEPFTKEPDTSKAKETKMASYAVNYPLGAYGVDGPPVQPREVYFTNATVWTCGPQGKLDRATILVRDGKIVSVGSTAPPAGADVVDLSGRHVTPGLIDCHSHSATNGGINESGQTITAEVRIGDFIDCNDVDIYRQLAGGLTAANVLHGSANTIGGQNQVIKLRWGALPEEIKFAGAPPGIKFALGENVKQSNWGDRFTSRYPQTRMGVEQLVRDEFAAAREYKTRWDTWNSTKRGMPPRRDLELDAIAEILDAKRLVHCHSYRQDEILALMRTCEDFGVRLGTFQHILEGYKVADVMAQHGVGGSSFSDWWAYKMEVIDAIPYNGALMHNAGVVVSFNSDSGELARRMNTEAAKAVKYGGLSEEDALNFVTLNPARQLGIDHRVGSIEAGKDADLAIWNAPPLSTYAACEQTWIDGRKYFDRQDDMARRARLDEMKTALVQKVLDSGDEPGEAGGRGGRQWPRCDIYCGHGLDHAIDEGAHEWELDAITGEGR